MPQFAFGKKIHIDTFKTAEEKKKSSIIQEEEWMIFNIFHNFLSINSVKGQLVFNVILVSSNLPKNQQFFFQDFCPSL